MTPIKSLIAQHTNFPMMSWLIASSLGTMFLNKNGIQPIGIIVAIICAYATIKSLSRGCDHEILILGLSLTFFFASSAFNLIWHSNNIASVESLDSPSRLLLSGIILIGISRMQLLPYLFWNALVISGVMLLLYIILTTSETTYLAPTWTVGNQDWLFGPQAFGTIAVLVLGLIALSPDYLFRDRLRQVLRSASLLILLFAAIEANTRAPFLALPFLLFLYVFSVPGQQIKRTVIGLIVLIGVFTLAYLADNLGFWDVPLLQKFLTAKNELTCYFETQSVCGSSGIRLNYFYGAILAFFDSPILGHGMNVDHVIANLITTKTIAPIPNFGNFHNDFFQTLITQGLVGLATIFAPLVLFFLYAMKVRKIGIINNCSDLIHLSSAILWILVLFVITGLTQNNLDKTATSSVFFFTLAYATGFAHSVRREYK